MEEIWKDILEYEGRYEVSNLGRVRNKKGFIKKLQIGWGGYYVMDLHDGKAKKVFLVHRLVATAFIPNPKNLPLVRHIDDCRTNCRADNLCWGSHKDNMLDKGKLQKQVQRLKNILISMGYAGPF